MNSMDDKIRALEAKIESAVGKHDKADALNALAWALCETESQRALILCEQAQKLARSELYQKGLADSSRNLAQINLLSVNYAEALSWALEALALYRELDCFDDQITALNIIGGVHVNLSNYPDALEAYLEVIKIGEQLDDKAAKAVALDQLGMIYGQLGDYQSALIRFSASLALYQAIDDVKAQADALVNVAASQRLLGDCANALTSAQDSLQLCRTLDWPPGRVDALISLGQIYKEQGESAQALACFEQALALAEALEDRRRQVCALIDVAPLCVGQGQSDAALAGLERALALARGERPLEIECHRALLETAKQLGHFEKALSHAEQFYTLRQAMLDEEAENRLQCLQVIHDEDRVREEAQIFLLRNVVLEQEIEERKQAEVALQQRNHQLLLLNQLGQAFSAMLDTQRIAKEIPKAIAELMGAEGASLWLWDEEQEGWLICRAFFHPALGPSSLLGVRVPPGQGIVGWVGQSGESVIVPSVMDDPRFLDSVDKQTGFRTQSLLAVPLHVHYAVVGVIEVVNKLTGDFEPDDVTLIETLANSAAIAIDNAILLDARRQLAAELKARNAELDAFAHTVAHDLKSSLNSIVGFASLVLEKHSQMSPEQRRQSIQSVVRGGQKMARVVDDLLLLANVHKAGLVERKPLNMAEVIAQVQERLAFMLQEYQAELILPKADWPVALGYAPWVEEVWLNYLSNALKYGGQPSQVELGATQQADGQACFWVRDNGPGVAPDDQPKLFTPFTRLAQEHSEGHGLGLSIVQRIVEKLGGEVGVESEGVVGQGSLFYFTLPLANETDVV